MKHDYWFSVTVSSQLSDKMIECGNIIVPLYNIDSFISQIPPSKGYYVNLPYVVRNKDNTRIKLFLEKAKNNDGVLGVFVHNTETLQIIRDVSFSKEVILGPSMYIWNNASKRVFGEFSDCFVYPYELNRHELRDISANNGIMIIYGRTPLMITENCVRNTKKRCQKNSGAVFEYLKDRKGSKLPIFFECSCCFNVIYNPVATSLHDYIDEIDYTNNFLFNFTDEEENVVNDIIDFYMGRRKEFPVSNTTKAYYVHGVE